MRVEEGLETAESFNQSQRSRNNDAGACQPRTVSSAQYKSWCVKKKKKKNISLYTCLFAHMYLLMHACVYRRAAV